MSPTLEASWATEEHISFRPGTTTDSVNSQALSAVLEELVAVVALVPGPAREVSHHEGVSKTHQSSTSGDRVVEPAAAPLAGVGKLLLGASQRLFGRVLGSRLHKRGASVAVHGVVAPASLHRPYITRAEWEWRGQHDGSDHPDHCRDAGRAMPTQPL